MKSLKRAFLMLVCVCAALTASAQGKLPMDNKKAASQQVDQIATDLGLSADQKKKVAALNAERDQKRAAIRAEINASTTKESTEPSEAAKAKAQADRKAMNQDYRQKFKAILTPEQLAKWKEMDKEMKRSTK